MKKFYTFFLLFVFTFLSIQTTDAQCRIVNNAFKSGENINYDLYFKLGLINAWAGKGFLRTQMVNNYKGASAYNISMQLNTSGVARSLYTVNDTLTSYIDMDLRPLLFTKQAFEGSDYSKEVQSFDYVDNKVKIRASRVFNGEKHFDDTLITEKCTYDYLSVLPLIRNIDYSGMKPGDRKEIQFLSGKDLVKMTVNYKGKSSVKANNGKRYNTIDISLTIYEPAFNNQKEAISASLTDDANRIPIVLNTHLKIGIIRAVLKSVSGERNK